MAQEIPTGEGLTFEKVWLLFQETREEIHLLNEVVEMTQTQVEKTSEKVDKTSTELGRLGNRLGEFVEGLVRPGMVRLFNERGIPLTQTFIRLEATHEGKEMEADIVGVNGEIAVVVEVKSTLEVADVKEHLERLEHFKLFFPIYAERQLLGAVAGMVIDQSVSRFAYRQGMFVIAQSGETVRLLNDENFQPRSW